METFFTVLWLAVQAAQWSLHLVLAQAVKISSLIGWMQMQQSHQSVSSSLYFLPFIYVFPLSDPTSLSHPFPFTNFKPEAKLLQIWLLLCKLSIDSCLECGWKLSERSRGGAGSQAVCAAHRALPLCQCHIVPCLRLVWHWVAPCAAATQAGHTRDFLIACGLSIVFSSCLVVSCISTKE